MDNTTHDLIEVKEVFDEHSVPLILIQGNLLGVIREKRLLPWDGDIDFYVLSKNAYPNILTAVNGLINRGYEFWEFYYTPEGKIIHWTLNSPNNIHVSLKALHHATDPKYLCETGIRPVEGRHGATGRDPTISLLEAKYFENAEELEFMGKKFLIPSPPEEYLAKEYGDGWRTPVKDNSWMNIRVWHTFFADKCALSPWPAIYRVDAPARIRTQAPTQAQAQVEKPKEPEYKVKIY